MSKKAKILDLLLSGKRLSAIDSFRYAKTYKISNRVGELRQEGYPIQDEWESTDESRFKVYYMLPKDIKKIKKRLEKANVQKV